MILSFSCGWSIPSFLFFFPPFLDLRKFCVAVVGSLLKACASAGQCIVERNRDGIIEKVEGALKE